MTTNHGANDWTEEEWNQYRSSRPLSSRLKELREHLSIYSYGWIPDALKSLDEACEALAGQAKEHDNDGT